MRKRWCSRLRASLLDVAKACAASRTRTWVFGDVAKTSSRTACGGWAALLDVVRRYHGTQVPSQSEYLDSGVKVRAAAPTFSRYPLQKATHRVCDTRKHGGKHLALKAFSHDGVPL